MQHRLVKYPVQHQLLKKCIKFFWELKIEHAELNHKIIPQRNINIRLNLNDTPQYACINNDIQILEDVNFSGLQDKNMNTSIAMSGNIHILGICFYPEGFFPFFNIPVNEFKNLLLGSNEAGFRLMDEINEQLKNIQNSDERIRILEKELVKQYLRNKGTPENFHQIFNMMKENYQPSYIKQYCTQYNISIRKLERQFNKYIGISAKTYCTLNRFHLSMNQLLRDDYNNFFDIAFDNGYYDQMHFIRDFKRFAGSTPRNFVKKKKSILQIGKFS